MNNIDRYHQTDINDVNANKLNSFKQEIFHFFNDQINNKRSYIQIKMLWNLSVAELASDSIVESVCSALKKIYGTEKRQMKLITLQIMIKLRLCLPTTKAERDKVVNKVIEEYRKLYPHQSSHKVSKQTRKRRAKKGMTTSPCIHRHFAGKDTVFTVPFD